jgi:glycolate oxidase iron-sulfur subunit
VMNASGCGAVVKEYARHLARDPDYAGKAERVAALTKDLSELLPELVPALKEHVRPGPAKALAYHPPCSLQHGQQLRGGVESALDAFGFAVALPAESHLCCGSAGTYSVLQPELAHRLRDRKLGHLDAIEADAVVSANVGCIQHLQSGTARPVRHWIEVVDEAMR